MPLDLSIPVWGQTWRLGAVTYPEHEDLALDVGRHVAQSLIALLVVLSVFAGVYFLLPGPAGGWDEARKTPCKSRLKSIGLACNMYSNDYGEQWPFSQAGSLASLSLLFPRYLSPRRNFVRPSTDDARGIALGVVFKQHQGSHEYLPGKLGAPLGSDAPNDLIVAYDKPPVHHRGSLLSSAAGRNVLFSDGHVAFMGEDVFQRKLMEDRKRYTAHRQRGAE